MNKIIINHAAPSKAGPISSLLLIIGLVSCASVFIYWQQLASDTKQLKLSIQARRHQPENTRSTTAKPDPAKTQEVSNAIAEIVLPWNSVFKALEAANDEEVQILAIEPNARTRLVRIHALAWDNEHMMHYLQNLNAQKSLKQVRLVSHEMVEINGHRAIELVAEAIWKA